MPSKLIFWHVSSNRIRIVEGARELQVPIVGGCKSVSRYDLPQSTTHVHYLFPVIRWVTFPSMAIKSFIHKGLAELWESERTSTIDKRMQKRVLARLTS